MSIQHRIPCLNPGAHGVSYHVAGSAEARSCGSAYASATGQVSVPSSLTRAEPSLFMSPMNPNMERVLESAARLQALVPDAVLVGGSAAAAYAGHRESLDHDHVLADLNSRFDIVLEAVESQADWKLARLNPQKVILGSLGGIETGIRQLIRLRPLETHKEELPSGAHVVVPTPEEVIRIKAYLAVKRNVTRDYVDVAALSDWYGVDETAEVLTRIDEYYTDPASAVDRPLATQVMRQLGNPQPKDPKRFHELIGLSGKWSEWNAVAAQTVIVAARMLERER